MRTWSTFISGASRRDGVNGEIVRIETARRGRVRRLTRISRSSLRLLVARAAILSPDQGEPDRSTQNMLEAVHDRNRIAAAKLARRLARLRRLAPLVGRLGRFVRLLHDEVFYRPDARGQKRCRAEFEALAGRGATSEWS